jgi:hypothetical protein
MDYTTELYYNYYGKEWVILQNGNNIIFAKKSAVVKIGESKYAISDDSRGKIKELIYDKSDIDIVKIKK